ncbi:MAG: hypothetical protein E7623_01485 [Ruminococcaceae bacterium]|nr:hypothetical protein [Oscillospiraceae bacterium]
MNNIIKNRKFKYGSSAVIFTVVVIAVIILLNVVLSALANTFLWYIEMDKEDSFFGLSQGAKDLLDSVEESSKEDLNVRIIFCMPLDKMIESTDTYRIYACAQSFAEEYDFISIDYLDTVTNPAEANKYKTTANTSINEKSIIIENGSQFRVYSMEAMYATAASTGQLFSFVGEYKIATCILQFTGDSPIVCFTEGHGENTETSELYELFEDAGFSVKTVDLAREEIDAETRILVINNPISDFLGADDTVNEIKKLSTFLGDFGNLWVFLDPTTRVLYNLEEMLADWGIRFGDAVIKDYSSSLSVDGHELVSVYSSEQTTGASLHAPLRSLETIPKTIVSNARPIYYEASIHNAYGNIDTSTVLYSTPNAVSVSFEDGSEVPGTYNLMTLTRESRIIDNEDYYSYILVSGTSQFAADKYLNGNTYGNSDILFAAMQACGKDTVPANIDQKVFEDTALDITTSEAYTWTAVYTVVLPVTALIIGLVVFIRRKYL